jgi:hypothetical protein
MFGIIIPQGVKIDSGGSGTFGATALTNTFFTEYTNLSTSGKFARIVSATRCNPWARQVKCVIFGNIM